MTSFWTNLLIVVHVLVALAIIGLVLLQHGKGADMGSGFGGGASGSSSARPARRISCRARPLSSPRSFFCSASRSRTSQRKNQPSLEG